MFDDLIDVEVIYDPIYKDVELSMIIKFSILNPTKLNPSKNLAYRILTKKFREIKNNIIHNPTNADDARLYAKSMILQYLHSLVDRDILRKYSNGR